MRPNASWAMYNFATCLHEWEATPTRTARLHLPIHQMHATHWLLRLHRTVPESVWLVWLMHMVGDVHQPLHNVSRCTMPAAAQCQPLQQDLPRGCRSGFRISRTAAVQERHSAEELHALWGWAIGTSSDPEAVISVAKVLPTQAVDANDQDVDLWVSESLKPAETKVYIAPIGDGKGPFTIDHAYWDQCALSRSKELSRVACGWQIFWTPTLK